MEPVRARPIDDHWQPELLFVPDSERAAEAPPDELIEQPPDGATTIAPPPFDAWRFELDAPTAGHAQADDDPDLALPHFDAEVRQPRYSHDVFERPLLRGSEFKARMVAKTSAVGAREKARLILLLHELFEERPHAAVYRVWLDFAPLIQDPAVAGLAIDLKLLWEDNPAFWLHRIGPDAPPRFHDSARGHFTWRAALRIAAERSKAGFSRVGQFRKCRSRSRASLWESGELRR